MLDQVILKGSFVFNIFNSMSFGVVLSKFSTYRLSLLKILFVYFWLHCVFIAVSRLSLDGASGGYLS